jgi:hypothetical protein
MPGDRSVTCASARTPASFRFSVKNPVPAPISRDLAYGQPLEPAIAVNRSRA